MEGQDQRLKVRIAAPPVDGKANAELVRFLAKKLDIQKSKIVVVRGETSPIKDVFCAGLKIEHARSLLDDTDD